MGKGTCRLKPAPYIHVAGTLGGARGSKSSIGDVKRDGIVNLFSGAFAPSDS